MWPALTFIYATVCDSLIYSFVMRWVKKEVSSAHGCGRKWTSLVVCRRVFSKSWPTFVMCYMLQQLYYSFLLNINECAENSLANMSYISNIGCIVLVELTQEKKKEEKQKILCVWLAVHSHCVSFLRLDDNISCIIFLVICTDSFLKLKFHYATCSVFGCLYLGWFSFSLFFHQSLFVRSAQKERRDTFKLCREQRIFTSQISTRNELQ